ncbi:hypothetical protein GSI_11176 [Ganoderma sinense ZZ0214-1]|uniref:Uncharacterized protein n=1 Tax=Ganoderma sinense ZZ0214-1 TaxID=1077348 RepID=A0A2G8RZ15_9APHY|nr:hypothetical protein GSI_11176 [Ganoderma sinense ZZ0214-1]
MATTIPAGYTPSVAELLFVLSESAKLVRYTNKGPQHRIREITEDSIVRILAIHTTPASGAVCLDIGPDRNPTLLISSDDPAFLSHISVATPLIRSLASAAIAFDSEAAHTAQCGLITYILQHSLGPHVADYNQLHNKLREDLEANMFKDVTMASEGSEVIWLRKEVEVWCDGLKVALDVIEKAPNKVLPGDFEEVDMFWAWAKRQYAFLVRFKNAYAHVRKYSDQRPRRLINGRFGHIDLPSAVNLLRYMGHIIRAIVPPLMRLANPETDRSQFAWLTNLPTRKLETVQSSALADLSSIDIDPLGLKDWLSTLVRNPLRKHDSERKVVESVIPVESVGQRWASYVENSSVHPEVTQLIDMINTSLASNSDPNVPIQWVHRSLIACPDTCCHACALLCEAIKNAYGLTPRNLYISPIQGDIAIAQYQSPCRIPALPEKVEEELKKLLSEKIKAIVNFEIERRINKDLVRRVEERRGVVFPSDSSTDDVR